MKANLVKRTLAVILVLAVFAVALPLSTALMASADPACPTPTSANDFSKRFVWSTTGYEDDYYPDKSITFAKDGTLNPLALAYEGGKAAVEATFLPSANFNFKWNSETEAYDPIWTDNIRIYIGKATVENKGDEQDIYVQARYPDSRVHVMSAGDNGIQTGIGNVTKGAKFTLTVEYDPDTTSISVWKDGAFLKTVSLATDKVSNFQFCVPYIHIGGNGVDEEGNPGTAVVSNVKYFGGYSSTIAEIDVAPELGDNTDFAPNLTLANTTYNTQYSTTGKVTLEAAENGNKFFFNGLENYYAKGQKLYLSVGVSSGANVSTGSGNINVYCGGNDTAQFGYTFRPAWNNADQIGLTKKTYYLNDGSDVTGSYNKGSMAFITYEFDSMTNTVTIWVHNKFAITGINPLASSATRCIGVYTMTGTPAIGIGINNIANSVTFSDFKAWVTGDPIPVETAPVIGDHDDLAGDLYFEDTALNSDWKDDGTFTVSASAAFKGVEWKEGDIIYYSMDVKHMGGSYNASTYGALIATNGSAFAGVGMRPGWNQSGHETGSLVGFTAPAVSFINKDGSYNPTNCNPIKVTVKYDVTANAISVWEHTTFYNAGYFPSINQGVADYFVGTYALNNGVDFAIGAFATVAGGNNPQFSNVHVWADKAPEPTNYAKSAEIVYNAGSAVKGSTVIPNEKYTISDAKSYAVKSFYVDGLDIDLTGGRSLTMSADFYLTTNTYTEAHIGVIPFLYNGTPIRMGLLANGDWSSGSGKPIQSFNAVYWAYGNYQVGNGLPTGITDDLGAQNAKVNGYSINTSATGAKVTLKAVLTATDVNVYANGVNIQHITFADPSKITPAIGFAFRSAPNGNAIDNFFVDGSAVVGYPQKYTYKVSTGDGDEYTFAPAPVSKTSHLTAANIAIGTDDVSYTASLSVDTIPSGSGMTAFRRPEIILGTFGEGEKLVFSAVPHWWSFDFMAGSTQLLTVDAPYLAEQHHDDEKDVNTFGNKVRDPRCYKIDSADAFNGTTSYTYEVTYIDGKLYLTYNGQHIINGYDTTSLDNFKPMICIGMLFDSDVPGYNAKSAVNMTGTSNVTYGKVKVSGEDKEFVASVENKDMTLYVADLSADAISVKVAPATGKVLVAGSLTYNGKKMVSTDDTTGTVYTAKRGDADEFDYKTQDMSNQNFSMDMLATGVRRSDDDSCYDGIRFLSRMNFDVKDLDGDLGKLQTGGALTVQYNGASHTIKDYGVIMSKNLADPTTLTIENAKWNGSGLNAIYAVTDTYVDVTIMMRWHTESAEAKCAVVYNARSYIILDDDTVVYSDPISDSVNAALAR